MTLLLILLAWAYLGAAAFTFAFFADPWRFWQSVIVAVFWPLRLAYFLIAEQ